MESQVAADQKTASIEDTDISSPHERLRSSSASSSSSTGSSEFQDPVQIDHFETGSNTSKDDNFALGSQRPEDDSALQSPPTQTMERPGDGSGRRIPSYVFLRNKSGNPMEWSMASNESLFSIHMGNMSFTGDQFSWLTKSGELNHLYKSGELPPSPEIPRPPMHEDQSQPSPSKANLTQEHDGVNTSPGPALSVNVTDPGHSEPTTSPREQKMNPYDQRKARPSPGEDQATPSSTSLSDTSGQSFAFPLLAGDGDSSSAKSKSGLHPVAEQLEQQKQSSPPDPDPDPDPDPAEAKTTAAPEAVDTCTSSLFSKCMSCFSCSSKTEKEAADSKD